MARDCSVVDDLPFSPGSHNNHQDSCQYVIINPIEDSRVGHESIDEEKFKELVWPKLVLGNPEKVRRERPLNDSN